MVPGLQRAIPQVLVHGQHRSPIVQKHPPSADQHLTVTRRRGRGPGTAARRRRMRSLTALTALDDMPVVGCEDHDPACVPGAV